MTPPASRRGGAQRAAIGWGGKHAPTPRRAPFVLLVLGLVVGGFCALLGLNTVSAADELTRQDLAARDQSVANSVVGLRNDVAASGAPGNLARAAAQLGMVPADDPAFVVVGADGSVRVLGSPGPATAPVYVAPTDPRPTAPPATHPPSSAKPTGTSGTKPTSSAKPTGTSTSATKTSTAKTSPAATSKAKTKSASGARSPRHGPATVSPAPTPDPTPTLTLPGGAR